MSDSLELCPCLTGLKFAVRRLKIRPEGSTAAGNGKRGSLIPANEWTDFGLIGLVAFPAIQRSATHRLFCDLGLGGLGRGLERRQYAYLGVTKLFNAAAP